MNDIVIYSNATRPDFAAETSFRKKMFIKRMRQAKFNSDRVGERLIMFVEFTLYLTHRC